MKLLSVLASSSQQLASSSQQLAGLFDETGFGCFLKHPLGF
jgi:hypothetical protein